MRSITILLAATAALAACHHSDRGRVYMPTRIDDVPVDSFYTFGGMVSAGGGPRDMPLSSIAARCANPAICTTQVHDGIVQVVGRKPGATYVAVDAFPGTASVQHRAIPIAFTPAPERPMLAVEAAFSPAVEIMHRADDASGPARCTPISSSVIGAEPRPDIHVYTCAPRVATTSGDLRYPHCAPSVCTQPEAYLLCAQVRDNVVVGTMTFVFAGGDPRVIRTDGTVDRRFACTR